MYNRLWSLHGFSWILNLKYMKIILKCNISCKPQSQLMLPTERMMWILSVLTSLYLRISQSCHTTEIQYNWSLGTRYNKNWNNWWKGIESLPQTLIFWSLYLWNQVNSVISNILNMKYQRFTTSGSKGLNIWVCAKDAIPLLIDY